MCQPWDNKAGKSGTEITYSAWHRDVSHIGVCEGWGARTIVKWIMKPLEVANERPPHFTTPYHLRNCLCKRLSCLKTSLESPTVYRWLCAEELVCAGIASQADSHLSFDSSFSLGLVPGFTCFIFSLCFNRSICLASVLFACYLPILHRMFFPPFGLIS